MMQKHQKRKNSILKKMVLTVVAVLLLQSLLLIGALILGGTVYQLNQNAFDILNERTINRKNYLENEMVNRWSKLDETEQTLQNKLQEVSKRYGLNTGGVLNSADAVDAMLSESAEPLVYLLRRQSVTGAFLILGNRVVENNETRPGVYFRDLDPKSNPADYSDLLMERGPAKIGKKLGISLDARWESRMFTALPEDQETYTYFYNQPLKAALNNPGEDFRNLGYWSHAFRLNLDTIDIITYSVPLVDEGGNLFGVLGVEISLPFINTLLPYHELDTKQSGAYLLGIDHGDRQDFQPVTIHGPLYSRVLGNADVIEFADKQTAQNIHRMENRDGVDTSYGSVQYLNLYNSNTPFADEQWALVGMDLQRNLLAFSYKMVITLTLALVLSLALGILLAYLVSRVVTAPVRSLVDRVLKSNPNEPVKFEKTHISEVDDLTASIEVLSQRVAASASKLSRIIRMASVPIGAFEFDIRTKRVFCTDRFFDIMSDGDVPAPFKEGIVDAGLFRDYMEKLNGRREKDSSESAVIYRLHDLRGYHKWVRLKIVRDQEKVLGVAEDITAEVQEKKKIEYERDYDLLTNLLNRRAFHSQMQDLFREPKAMGVAALVMLDLDNLKYINDTYGHDCGDQYIRCTADILTRCVPGPALLSRMSGDEFYVFYYGYDSREQIRTLLERLQAGFREQVFQLPREDKSMRVRASAGVSWYPHDSRDKDELIRFADFAMYTVKKTVKGAFQEFSREAYLRDSYLLKERENLNRFIEEVLVEYHFQPIVDAATGEIFGYEALMRPQMEGLRNPMEVLNLARSQSKLYQIERLTMFHALEAFAQQDREQREDLRLFVNSVANQSLTSEDIAELEHTFASFLHRIVLELTEEEKTDEDCLQIKQSCVRRWGSELALDDFGAGYNGEGVLLKIHPQYVKIDCDLVHGVDMDPDRYQLMQNMITYAKERRMKIVAEGVETQGELKTLLQLDVDYLQGFYLGRPTPLLQPLDPQRRQEIIEFHQHKIEEGT